MLRFVINVELGRCVRIQPGHASTMQCVLVQNFGHDLHSSTERLAKQWPKERLIAHSYDGDVTRRELRSRAVGDEQIDFGYGYGAEFSILWSRTRPNGHTNVVIHHRYTGKS